MKQKILIAVPAKGDYKVLEEHTMMWLHLVKYDYKIFVKPQDELNYKTVIQLPVDRIVVVDVSDDDIDSFSDRVVEYARTHGYDFLYKVEENVTVWDNKDGELDFAKTLKRFYRTVDDGMMEFKKEKKLAIVRYPVELFMYDALEIVYGCGIIKLDKLVDDTTLHAINLFKNSPRYIPNKTLIL